MIAALCLGLPLLQLAAMPAGLMLQHPTSCDYPVLIAFWREQDPSRYLLNTTGFSGRDLIARICRITGEPELGHRLAGVRADDHAQHGAVL